MISREEAIELRNSIIFKSKDIDLIEETKAICLSRMNYMAIDNKKHLYAYVEKPIYKAENDEWIPSTGEPWLMYVDFFPFNKSINHPDFQYPENLILVNP